jgi:hypothetical protein
MKNLFGESTPNELSVVRVLSYLGIDGFGDKVLGRFGWTIKSGGLENDCLAAVSAPSKR